MGPVHYQDQSQARGKPRLLYQGDVASEFLDIVVKVATKEPDIVIVGADVARLSFIGSIPAMLRIFGKENAFAKAVEYRELDDADIAFVFYPEDIILSVSIRGESIGYKGCTTIVIQYFGGDCVETVV